MRRINVGSIDRRLALGAGLSAISVVLVVVGLIAVVSGLSGDGVQLPKQGSIDEIVQDSDNSIYLPLGGDPAVAEPQPPQGPKPVRMAIPRLFIDAPVIDTGFEDGTNIPDVPDRPDQVSWYTFTPTPGMNNNAVFSGHVDWQTRDGAPIPGVFYRLRELRIGDEITIALEDGSKREYRVTGNVATKYDDPNVTRAMGGTQKEVITIITCGGSWINQPSQENGGNYSHRVIVRAEPVVDEAAAAAAASAGS